MLAWALAYARAGFKVFPCGSGLSREYGESGKLVYPKHPLTRHGFKDAITDEATIRGWWARWPHAAIGMPTGTASGLIVVDVDRHGDDNGFASLARLSEQFGFGLPDPVAFSRTPSGGAHLFFRAGNVSVRNSTGRIGPYEAAGVDVRGEGGYVIVPPSVMPNGCYEWIGETSDAAGAR